MTPRITPEDFASDTPPIRIIGSECEYNIQNIDSKGVEVPLENYISDDAIRNAGFFNWNDFLNNGARLYEDVDHLEYASPESLGARQAAAADLAGPLVMGAILDASGYEHRGLYRIAGSHMNPFFRRGETSGYHENYMMPRKSSQDWAIERIVPAHLASRLWAMSGLVGPDGFVLSQKVAGIGGRPVVRGLTHQTQHGSKPMVTIPTTAQDRDTMSNARWARVEVRFADPGLSPTIRYLAFATTSLMLRLVEHRGKLKHRVLQRAFLENPVSAARLFSSDLTLTATAPNVLRKQVTAINVGEMLATQAQLLSEKIELPEEEQAAIPLWFQMLDQLRNVRAFEANYGSFAMVSDFAAKHRHLAKLHGYKRLHTGYAPAARDAMLWDRVVPTSDGQLWWQHLPGDQVDPLEIDRLIHTPPPTRAARRALIINRHGWKLSDLNWKEYQFINREEHALISDAYGY